MVADTVLNVESHTTPQWPVGESRSGTADGRLTVGEPLAQFSYLSVFTHFLSNPAENLQILRKLYIEHELSSYRIEEITDSSWPKSTIVNALKKHDIQRQRVSVHTKYGEKIVGGRRVPHLSERKTIKKIIEMRNGSHSFQQIATVLNEQGIPNRSGGHWDKTTIGIIYKRESIYKKETQEKPS